MDELTFVPSGAHADQKIGDTMEIRILGHQLDIQHHSGHLTIVPRGQIRQLLCVLAIDADRVVPTQTLLDRLWEETQGRDLTKSLKQAIYSARQVLPANRLVTTGGGYKLQLASDDYLDLADFRRLTDQARTLQESQPTKSATSYQQALELWGDPPLGDLPDTTPLEPVRQALLGELRDVREELTEVRLFLHRYREVIASATRWLAEDPFNEHLRGLLMLALNGSARKGEALQLYQDLTTLLGPQTTPGGWLQHITRQITNNTSKFNWHPRPLTLPSPTNINTTVPSVARIYDFLLGGKDNFAPDRAAAGRILEIQPLAAALARSNRGFLERVVSALTEAGVRQFLDLGTGIPTTPNVHEIAQSIAPECRVVYVDNDPIVAAHNNAIRACPGVGTIQADVRDSHHVLTHQVVTDLIHPAQPTAVLMIALLHFIPDSDDPHAVVAAYRDWLPPGGYLAISTTSTDGYRDQVAHFNRLAAAYNQATASNTTRHREEIEEFFGGWPLLPPGLVETGLWRHNGPSLRAKILAGVARKPRP